MARILVVDDAAFIRRWCRTTLEGGGHEVFEAIDGKEAVSLYQHLRPDLVLLDLLMPVLDGLGALRQIRAADPQARVVVLTTDGRMEAVYDARIAGAMDFLLKPCSTEVFLERVNRALPPPPEQPEGGPAT
jgi:two-component system chemotaxis response regulator CheY